MGAPIRKDIMTRGPAGLGGIYVPPGFTTSVARYIMHPGSSGVVASMGADLAPAALLPQTGLSLVINGMRQEFYTSLSQTLGTLAYPYITRVKARQGDVIELFVENRDVVLAVLALARFTIELDEAPSHPGTRR